MNKNSKGFSFEVMFNLEIFVSLLEVSRGITWETPAIFNYRATLIEFVYTFHILSCIFKNWTGNIMMSPPPKPLSLVRHTSHIISGSTVRLRNPKT